MEKIGKNHHISSGISDEYLKLSESDYLAAETLATGGSYRQAIYLVIQAMEKLIRAKVFTLVDAKNKYFRQKNRNHSIDEAVQLLIEIISKGDTVLKEQHIFNFKHYLLGDLNYQRLNNSLRYPWFSEKFQRYTVIEVAEQDYLNIQGKFLRLKTYLADF